MAIGASRLARRPAAGAYTWGFTRVDALSAQANGITLVLLWLFARSQRLPGGLLVVIIGIIAVALDQKIENLRKGRSFVVESGHTLILGWSPRIFTIVSELVVANENQPGACIVVLAPEDKTVMEDELRDRAGDPGGTRIVCRTGDPSSLNDLAMVNIGAARSIIVLAEAGAAGLLRRPAHRTVSRPCANSCR